MFDENKKTNCRDDFSDQCYNIAADEWKRKRKEKDYDRCWWKIDENKDEKAYKKNFKKKGKNFRYMMFEDFVVKNLNARISTKYHINDRTSFSNIIENFSFELKYISEKENDVWAK